METLQSSLDRSRQQYTTFQDMRSQQLEWDRVRPLFIYDIPCMHACIGQLLWWLTRGSQILRGVCCCAKMPERQIWLVLAEVFASVRLVLASCALRHVFIV